jgi:hypothetical protein
MLPLENTGPNESKFTANSAWDYGSSD